MKGRATNASTNIAQYVCECECVCVCLPFHLIIRILSLTRLPGLLSLLPRSAILHTLHHVFKGHQAFYVLRRKVNRTTTQLGGDFDHDGGSWRRDELINPITITSSSRL